MNMEHGTVAMYRHGKCRCPECVTAQQIYYRGWVKRARERGLAPNDSRHGTRYAYRVWACRCDLCSEAASDYQAKAKGDKSWREVFGVDR